MPVAPSRTKTPRPTTRKKSAREPAVQQPLIPNASPARPQDHNGVPVVSEQLLNNLPNAPFRISRLYLADGSVAFACRDCLHTGDTRGQVMEHRNAEHGARFGKRKPQVKFEAEKKQAPDPVLPPRGDQPAPSDPLQMTLAEMLSLAPSLCALGDLVDSLESDLQKLREQLQERAADQRKIDVYDSLHNEVVELRLMVKQTGSYERLRAEVLELRAWKKKMVQRLTSLGFNFTEEDQ